METGHDLHKPLCGVVEDWSLHSVWKKKPKALMDFKVLDLSSLHLSDSQNLKEAWESLPGVLRRLKVGEPLEDKGGRNKMLLLYLSHLFGTLFILVLCFKINV